MNRDRLKQAIREARERAENTWRGWRGDKQVEFVSIPLTTLNLLIKASKKELSRS